MAGKYLIELILRSKKEGTGFKDAGKELQQVGEAAKSASKPFDLLKGSWAGLAAMGLSVTGVVMGVRKAFEMGREGAAILQTSESFETLMQKVGASANTLDLLREASRGTVDDMTLMSSTTTLLAGAQGQLASSLAAATPQLMEIAKAANKLNPTLGTTTFMYESLALGVKRASPLILDNLGLTVKIGEANDKMAKQLGKSVEELTAEEQKMALLNATLEAGNVLIQQVGGDTASMADSFEQASAQIKNSTDQIKASLAPAIAEVTQATADAIPKITTTANQIVTLAEAGMDWVGAALSGRDATAAFNAAILGSIDMSSIATDRMDDYGTRMYRAADATETMAATEEEAVASTEQLADAQKALGDAVDEVRSRYEAFYGTLAEGIVEFRDLGKEQAQSAADYEAALADLEAKAKGVYGSVKKNFEASLPDPTAAKERLNMTADAWDEWGLRLQDIIQNGVASPWYAALQQMGMVKPPDVGVKQWAEDLKSQFYEGELPQLINTQAEAWQENTAKMKAAQEEATAAYNAEVGNRKAALQGEIDALKEARAAELEAEKEARNQMTMELALSLAEQTGMLEAWSKQRFGPDFSQVADSAKEVTALLDSGILSIDSSLAAILGNTAAGISKALDMTGGAAEENKAKIDTIFSGDWAAQTQAKVQNALNLKGMLPPEDIAELQAGVASIPEAIPADPFLAMTTSFQGAATAIMEGAGTMDAGMALAFENMQGYSDTVAQAIVDQWTGNSVFPDLITGAMTAQGAMGTAFLAAQAVAMAAAANVRAAWAGTYAALQAGTDAWRAGLVDVKNTVHGIVQEFKKIPEQITVTINTVISGGAGGGGGGLQHGGQWEVQGPPGIDRVPVSFRATAGEIVTVTPRGEAGRLTNNTTNQTRTVYVSGDTHNWMIQDPTSMALALALVEDRRKERLNAFMGV